MSVLEAADVYWAIMDRHLEDLLVFQRGWTTAAYAQRLSGSLAVTLLRPN